ncbi:MAG: hypothetical protein IT242_05355 [Bacteroidia bacterium]|nr:hypothetical protein [Bacteroidia bacterium]
MKTPKIVFTSIVFLTVSLAAFAQDYVPPAPATPYQPKSDFWNRIFVGGNLGLQFGTETFVEVAPVIGYKVTERFMTGIGIKYLYYRFKDAYADYSLNEYGGSVFTRYLVLDNLFAHLEYEVLNVPDFYNSFRPDARINVGSLFAGGGYRQMMGSRSAIELMILFNLNESRYSPYQNPIIRLGFAFGL